MVLKELLEEQKVSDYSCKELIKRYGADAEVEVVKKISRQTGTGYRDIYCKIEGSSDAIVLHENTYSQQTGTFDTTYSIKEDYFSEQKEYGRICAKLSKKYDLPWTICSILGTNEEIYPKFKETVKQLSIFDVRDYGAYENMAGIDRRNSEIRNLLPDEEFKHVSNNGQDYSRKMFYYLFEKIFENKKALEEQLSKTKEYTKLIEDYNFTPKNAIKFLSVIEFKWGFLNKENPQDRDSLIKKEMEILTKKDPSLSSFINGGKVKSSYSLQEPDFSAYEYSAFSGIDGTNPCYGPIAEAEKSLWGNLKANELIKRLENGEIVSNKFLIDKLDDNSIFDFNASQLDYIKKLLIVNSVVKNDTETLKNILSVKTYKVKIMPEKVAKDLASAIRSAIKNGDKINFSNINYENVMSICAPIKNLAGLSDEQKTNLQKVALNALLTQNRELSCVISIEGGIDFHAKKRTKTEYLNSLINDHPDLVVEKFDKVMEFLKTDFDNTKAYSVPGEYPGDVNFYSEMAKFFEKEILGEDFPEIEEDVEKKVYYCVPELRTGDAFTVFTDGTARFGEAIEPVRTGPEVKDKNMDMDMVK